jgi:transposase
MARPKVPKRIGNYGDDFKMKAVRLTFMEGTQVQDVAKALDIHPFMLSRWRKEYREGKIVADRRVKRVVDVTSR